MKIADLLVDLGYEWHEGVVNIRINFHWKWQPHQHLAFMTDPGIAPYLETTNPAGSLGPGLRRPTGRVDRRGSGRNPDSLDQANGEGVWLLAAHGGTVGRMTDRCSSGPHRRGAARRPSRYAVSPHHAYV
jgi:hypothetical protein